MIIYLIVLFALAILAFLGRATMSSIWDWIGILILVVFAGGRVYTGADYLSYQLIYQGDYQPGQVERGYLLIQNFMNMIHVPFNAFLMLWAACSLVLYCLFVRQYFRPAIIPIAYYYCRFFFLRDMGQIRAAMVCSICMLSIAFIVKRKPIPFIIIVAGASLIHVSALFFLLAYPFCRIFEHLHMKGTVLLLGAGFLAGTVATQILSVLVVRFLPRYAPYVTNPAYVGGSLFDPVTLMHVLICLLGFYILEKDHVSKAFIKNTDAFKVLLLIYLFSTLTLLALARLTTISGRLSTISTTVETILLPTIIYSLMPKYTRTVIVATACLFIFGLIFILSGTYHQYIPYVSIF